MLGRTGDMSGRAIGKRTNARIMETGASSNYALQNERSRVQGPLGFLSLALGPALLHGFRQAPSSRRRQSAAPPRHLTKRRSLACSATLPRREA